ncbi:MAG: hypothetical protein V1693_01300 [Nanoarchaeota archaeon]
MFHIELFLRKIIKKEINMIDPKIKNNGNGDDDEVDDDVDDMEDDATKTGEHTYDDEIDEIDDDE